MELFTIQCTTCRARLKVNDESVIGQILGCPKCGSMVQVVPPIGWQRQGASDSSSSVDLTLGAAPQPAAAAKQGAAAAPQRATAKAAAAAKPKAAAGVPPALPTRPAAPVTAPPLPISPAQPAVLSPTVVDSPKASVGALVIAWLKRDWPLVAAGLGSGVVLGSLVWWFAMTGPAEVQAIDQPTAAKEPTVAMAPAVSATGKAEPRSEEHPNPTTAAQAAADTAADVDTETTKPVTEPPASPPVDAAAEQPEPESNTEAAAPIAASQEKTPSGSLKLEPLDKPATGASAAPAEGDAAVSAADKEAEPDDKTPAGISRRLGRATESAGIPPLTQAEVDERLTAAVPKVEFVKTPLAQFLTFIGELANLPITIDEAAFQSARISRLAPVTVRLVDTTAGDALQKALDQLDLRAQVRDNKLVIAPKASAKPARPKSASR